MKPASAGQEVCLLSVLVLSLKVSASLRARSPLAHWPSIRPWMAVYFPLTDCRPLLALLSRPSLPGQKETSARGSTQRTLNDSTGAPPVLVAL